MKFKKKIELFAVSVILLAVACSKEDTKEIVPPPIPPTDLQPATEPVFISTSILAFGAEPSTNEEQEKNTQFKEGDKIQLHIDNQNGLTFNKELTFDLKSWTPELTWNEISSEQAMFVGIHPLQKINEEGRFLYEVPTNQNQGQAYGSINLLSAKSIVNRRDEVALEFHHLLSLLEINLHSEKDAYQQEELTQAIVKVKTFSQMEVDAWKGDISGTKGEETLLTMKNMGNGKFTAILCPQPILKSWQEDAWVEIHIGEQTILHKAPLKIDDTNPFTQLKSGEKTSIQISLKKKEEDKPTEPENPVEPPVDNDWKNKTVWVHGVNNPPLEQWGYAYTFPYKVIGLEWKREYGWYDCNKIDPVASTHDDMNMCWAAAASNLIYWWLDQNKENLQRYGKYAGPHTYNDSRDCDVFKFFKDHFADKGNWINVGIDWFFTGKPVTTANPSFGNHKGFFSDVFTGPMLRITYGYHATEDIKQAILNQEAIGMSIILKNGTAGHAISVWGATFDEKGEVCELYITENNDIDMELHQGISPMQPGKLCPVGLYPKKIRQAADGQWWMESSTPDRYTILIEQFYFLDSKEKQWQEYFKQHNA